MKKRFLASLLSLVMLLTMLPMTAFAASTLEAITNVGTLSVTATKDSDSLSVKTAAEEGQEGEAVNAYSYLLHTKAVTTDDYLSALNAEGATPVAVTDGNLSEAVVTEGQTHIIVYTVVADGETDAGKINAWACAEITPADDGQTPPAGDTGSLTLDDTDTNVTVAADKKTVTLSDENVTVDFDVKKGYAPKATNSNSSTKVTVNFALKTAATADKDAVWTATIGGASATNVTTAETITLTAEKIAFTVVAGDTNVQIAEANKNVDLSASYTLEVTATDNYKPKDIANTITFSQKNSTTTWTGTFADTYVGPGVEENGTARSLTIESESTGSVTPTGSLTVTKGADANITLADDVEVDLTKAEATVINFEAKKGYKVSASAVQGVTVALAINKTPDTTPASGNVAWTATISGAKDANITDAKTITLSSAAMTLTLDVSDANVSADKTSINLTEGYTFTVKVKENFEPTCTVNGITFAKTGSTADADGNIEWTFTVADDFTGTEDDVVIASVTAGTKYAVTVNIPTADAEKASVIAANSTLTDISNGGTAVIVLKVKDGFTVSGTYGADNTALNFTEDDSVAAGTGFTAYKAEIKPVSANLTVAITVAAAETNPPAAEKYTIKFAAGTGATGEMDNVEVAKNASGATEYTIPASTFTAPTGKEFDVWTVAPNTVTISGNKLTIPADFDTATEITLTATWKDAAPETPDNTVDSTPTTDTETKTEASTVETAPSTETLTDAVSKKELVIDAAAADSTQPNASVEIKATAAAALVPTNATADYKVTIKTHLVDISIPKALFTSKLADAGDVKLDVKSESKKVNAISTTNDVKVFSIGFTGKKNSATASPIEIKDQKDSPLTVSFPVEDTYTTANPPVIVYINGTDLVEYFEGTFNSTAKTATFALPHLSDWTIMAKEAADDLDITDGNAEPEPEYEVSFEAKNNLLLDGIVTVTGLEANKLHVVQITRGAGTTQSNTISFATADNNGALSLQVQDDVRISVWSTTASDTTSATLSTITSLVSNHPVSATTTNP